MFYFMFNKANVSHNGNLSQNCIFIGELPFNFILFYMPMCANCFMFSVIFANCDWISVRYEYHDRVFVQVTLSTT